MKQVRYLVAGMIVMLAIQADAQDEGQLSDLRADTARRTQEISAAKSELDKLNVKISTLNADLLSATEALEEADSNAVKAARDYAIKPTPANKRVADRASSLRVLAERKIASLEKRLNFSTSKQAAIEKVISENSNRVSSNNARIDQLAQDVAVQQKANEEAEALEALKKEEALIKKQAEDKKRELELAALAKLEAEKKVAEPEYSPQEKAQVNAAQAAVLEIETYLSGDVRKRGSLHKPQIRSSKNGKAPLEHLGGEIYMAELTLDAGEHRLNVDSSRYRLVVSQKDDGELFRIYFDNRERKKRLMTYKSAYLKNE